MKNIKSLNEHKKISENGPSHTNLSWELAEEINKVIDNLDPDMDVTVLATAIGFILKNEYGSHNFKPFMKALKNL